MIFDKVVDLLKKVIEYGPVGGDKRRLGTVAASEVLGGYDRNGCTVLSLYEKYLAVVVGKICALDNLGDERPEFERLVGRLMVEHKIYAADLVCLANETESAQKLLGNGERSLPYLGVADLSQNPFENVGNRHGI